MLVPLNYENVSQYQRTNLIVKRSGNGLPSGVKIIKILGKGSNNTVYLAKKNKTDIVFRVPRTNSDTQRIGNASWEFRNSVIAAQLGVAPHVYDAWYNRHASSQQRSGLHMITEYFPIDVHEMLMEKPEEIIQNYELLQQQTISHLRKMANASMFCYDLKASNMVARLNPFDVRFVDFGRDFAEWRPYMEKNDHIDRAPVLSYLQKLVDIRFKTSTFIQREGIYRDVIFVVMLIILSANLEFTIQQSTSAIRICSQKRHFMNFLFNGCTEMRQCLPPELISLVKDVLRHRDVRDTIRHYTGRRNCGTKRTFNYSGFGPFPSLL
jgi:hypothetical protein